MLNIDLSAAQKAQIIATKQIDKTIHCSECILPLYESDTDAGLIYLIKADIKIYPRLSEKKQRTKILSGFYIRIA